MYISLVSVVSPFVSYRFYRWFVDSATLRNPFPSQRWVIVSPPPSLSHTALVIVEFWLFLPSQFSPPLHLNLSFCSILFSQKPPPGPQTPFPDLYQCPSLLPFLHHHLKNSFIYTSAPPLLPRLSLDCRKVLYRIVKCASYRNMSSSRLLYIDYWLLLPPLPSIISIRTTHSVQPLLLFPLIRDHYQIIFIPHPPSFPIWIECATTVIRSITSSGTWIYIVLFHPLSSLHPIFSPFSILS